MNSFLLVWDVFSFVFWENPRPGKKRFEIIWPLVIQLILTYLYMLTRWSRKLMTNFCQIFWNSEKDWKILLSVVIQCLFTVLIAIGGKYIPTWSEWPCSSFFPRHGYMIDELFSGKNSSFISAFRVVFRFIVLFLLFYWHKESVYLTL